MSTSTVSPPVDSPPSNTEDSEKTSEASTKGPVKPSRQRFKPQLSCTLCRSRKLKCDRNSPCQNCVKRDLSATCTYIHAGIRRDKASAVQKPANGGHKDVQSQISHLEELVVSLMNRSGNATNSGKDDESRDQANALCRTPISALEEWTDNSGVKQATDSFGSFNIDDDQTNYVGTAHWAAILDNIACLKDTLGNASPQTEEKTARIGPQGPALLTGCVPRATRTEILTALPDKGLVDLLIKEYFDTPDIGTSLIHLPTFMKQYENFWINPSETSIQWIGLLFSILTQAAFFANFAGRDLFKNSLNLAVRDPSEMANMFLQKIVQCLILGDYTEPGPFTVETLVFYFIAEHLQSQDTIFGNWMVFGLTVRAAMRLGLHRDASNSSKISVFQGEMNRRLWSVVAHLDLQTSCQVGLPRMVRDNMYDTQGPRNLADGDFDENTTVLPPARSKDDLTQIGFHNVKHAITDVFGKIVDLANSTASVSYDEVMKLDKTLHETHQATPEDIKARSVDDLKIGSNTTRTRKTGVWITFNKSRCILHRKFFTVSKETGTYPYPYSMKSCVDASMNILQSQIYLHSQTRLGMPLYHRRWIASSLMSHDFLLAAMLICLYMGHCMSIDSLEQRNAQLGIRVKSTREDMLQALRDSHGIWQESSSTSREAMKAAQTLEAILNKVKGTKPTPTTYPPPVVGEKSSPPRSTRNHPMPWLSGVMSKPQSLSWQTPPNFDAKTPTTDLSNFQDVADVNKETLSMDLDWDVWDNQFYNNGVMGQNPPEAWNFDPAAAIPFPDPDNSFMQWEQSGWSADLLPRVNQNPPPP
ncbi:fungal-specific transcription factor domain-containing protein [Amylocarpus encephaloides]|uniref:Fungal-specific transcription factor domain-containing protein n=1 Tax=Amylocarpus encephaloides TaxID=45428 RepID=A0A9P8C3G4_9HELO|nr:fungal-specific transcription factor domain-containing protein [Amylocarpus encephaloides]